MKIHHLLAPNPGIFTGLGTNTWVLADAGEAIVIDPGPMLEDHVAAVVDTVAGYRTVGVLVTHTHPDHAPAANPIGRQLDVPVYGRDPGPAFKPDVRIADGETMTFGDREVEAIHTPGHTPDHLCFLVDRVLFSGDHIMGGSTVVVEEMTDYLRSLDRLADLDLERIHPGHGPVIDQPEQVIAEYKRHRLDRERQIVEAVAGGAPTVGDVVHLVYADVDPTLHFAAAQSTAAHLRKLEADGVVALPDGTAEWTSSVSLRRDTA
ncbi:MAG: MBL fold metallo-hydrolase [Acidimicrobiia bacterium]|nr:MBL fold metallo-hydrolase [Acidimicrobiia bacterium]